MTAFEQLQQKLHEIFQLDKRELDFGIYRIMNLKADEIAHFIDKDLLSQVKTELAGYAAQENKDIQAELNQALETAKNLGVDPETSPKVVELRKKLATAGSATSAEIEIYSHLYNFFKRYYCEGDFISQRRYKDGVYALPYEGEEVKLYWANADQYYIKSGENFTNYTFKVGPHTIRFEVVEATTEQNNNKEKKERRFNLVAENPARIENGVYVVSFSYLPDSENREQNEINAIIGQTLLNNPILTPCKALLAAIPAESKVSVLAKHLNTFTEKNTSDYFIHKNLGKFLRQEMDFYIKNEIMHLDDIEAETAPKVESYLAKVKVFRKIADKIITFLASLEDFQKKLWLKKKFVLETNYCITLDRVPEKLYAEIATNEAQRKEWVKLFAIDEIEQDTTRVGYSEPLTVEFLKENPFLVLDTVFFSAEFKYELLKHIDDLDKNCNGLLIHSENFQALNLLQEKYREKVQCIYIDPPYNAKTSEIVYKNTYKHSSWLALMNNRIKNSYHLQTKNSSLIVAIDENEQERLGILLKQIFPDKLLTAVSCIHNTRGIQGNNFSYNHETYYFSYPNKSGAVSPRILEQGIWEKFRNWGGNSDRSLGYAMFYPIYFKRKANGYEFSSIGEAPSIDFHPNASNIIKDDIVEVWPIDDKGVERKWRYSRESTLNNLAKNKHFIRLTQIGKSLQIEFYKTKEQYPTCWTDKKYDASIFGSKVLNDILGKNIFSFPKSIYTVMDSILPVTESKDIILDYFAGSGTTGHAVINLNREDQGNRKYILCEVGTYFDTVTKPRIEKVIYSEDWKGGKPISRKGSSHCFKYIRLESYEDTLDSLAFTKRTQDQADMLQDSALKQEYMLKYMLNLETKDSLLNIANFNHPFDYQMRITRNGETKTVPVDLVETFNYLIGLQVESMLRIDNILRLEGRTRTGEKTLVLWRDTTKTNHEALNKYFQEHYDSTKTYDWDVIYVNGDNNLENVRTDKETWKVRSLEKEFLKRMFATQEA